MAAKIRTLHEALPIFENFLEVTRNILPQVYSSTVCGAGGKNFRHVMQNSIHVKFLVSIKIEI